MDLEGSVIVFMDHYFAPLFDLCCWEYCYSNEIFPVAVPAEISAGLRALNFGIMAKYTTLMLMYMHSRYNSVKSSTYYS